MLIVDDLKLRINTTRILNGVSFEVRENERLGIIGPNGSGKTTLFNSLSGFVIPTSGKITFRSEDVTFMAPHKRANLGLGRVFQNFGIFREMTLLENVITALEGRPENQTLFGTSSSTLKKQAFEHLKTVGLVDKAHDKASSLSGGQMRLLEIVRTIAFGAQLFLLDEPTAGVSPKMKQEVQALLNHLHEMKKTVIIIEHDMNFIQKFCDRIVVLDQGRVVIDDTQENVRNNPLLQEIYFGTVDNNKHNGHTSAATR